MKKLFLRILYTLFLTTLASCQSVTKKIEDTTESRKKRIK